MCGRFTLTVHQLEEVVAAVDVTLDPTAAAAYRPRYNIAPGNRHWLLRSGLAQRELVPASWGLVNSWARDPAVGYRQINARAESLASKPAWRVAFRERRCLIPADGFYEWSGPAKDRRPIWFHAPGRAVFWLAGLWEDWTSPATGEVRTTFTIVTTPSSPPVAEVHDRMPAIVPATAFDGWLRGPSPAELLRPASSGTLVARPVSKRVNTPGHDDSDCLELDAERLVAPKQGTLF
jgi:putative SOS response-associated peptidase YedK